MRITTSGELQKRSRSYPGVWVRERQTISPAQNCLVAHLTPVLALSGRGPTWLRFHVASIVSALPGWPDMDQPMSSFTGLLLGGSPNLDGITSTRRFRLIEMHHSPGTRTFCSQGLGDHSTTVWWWSQAGRLVSLPHANQ